MGLDFVCTACAPCVLAIISYSEFEVLKKLVKRCQEHLNGSFYRSSKYDKGELFLHWVGELIVPNEKSVHVTCIRTPY